MQRFIIFALLLFSPAALGESWLDRADCSRRTADQFFFPAGMLGKRTKSFDADQFARSWYSRHLRAMSEPSLSCTTAAGEAYRFLWLRTWGAPVAIRIERDGNVATLAAVTLDGAGGYEPRKVAKHVQRKLSEDEWKTATQGLEKIAFWKLPGQDKRDGLDGAQWILEGRRGTQYHLVDRWSPETGAYREFCLSLVKIAGLLPSGNDKRDAIY